MAKSDHVTPAAEPPTEIEAIAQAHGNRPENLIEMLHAVQHRFGYVSDQAVHRLAVAVNRSRAEVHGVLTFYHDFRRETPGRHIIKICRAEACQAMGCRSLVRHAEHCLGNCALSPAMMIDGALHGRVSPGRFDELVDGLAMEHVQ
jgi:formate dehydrogenase subunit gamma